MKIAKAIERADELRPNPFSEEQKVRWLSELDGKIAREVFDDKSFLGYTSATDSEKELLIEEAYCDIYLFYLSAMIDFFSRDYTEYNNSMALFNHFFDSFLKANMRGDAGINLSLLPQTDKSDKTELCQESEGKNNEKGMYYVNLFK